MYSVRYDGVSCRGLSLFVGAGVAVFYIIPVTFVMYIYVSL
nr:MAG TPA: hypothetical protein [Caudoviricetes sp.]